MKDLVNKLLEEASTHTVTVELVTGDTYHGQLINSEHTMNVTMNDALHTARSGKVTHHAQVTIRGSQIQLIILPEMLQYAPMFEPSLLEQSHMAGKKRKR